MPSIAGPKRPQDRVALTEAKAAFRSALGDYVAAPDETTRRRRELGSSVDEAVEETFPASDPAIRPPTATATAGGRGPRSRPRSARAAGSSSPTPVTMDDGTSSSSTTAPS